jgi:ABC-type dipeptide/oligopeptide/nickel transport system permease subunit
MIRRQKLALMGLAILAIFGLLATLAPYLAPCDPKEMFTPMLPPSRLHPLGTNDIGQDIFSELLYGARFSLLIGFLSAAASTAIGLWLGLISGYYDKLGFAIMRMVDIFLAIPRFPLIILMAAFLRPGLKTLVLFFVLFGWSRTTRLVRSQILSERNKEYVDAARLVGASDFRILGRHLLPSAIPIALVRFIMEFQHVILAESGLSFLGLGDPTVKSWGTILHYAFEYPTIFISDVWVRWVVPPGACITLMVLALTFVGFSLEEWSNPRLSRPQTFSEGGSLTISFARERLPRLLTGDEKLASLRRRSAGMVARTATRLRSD